MLSYIVAMDKNRVIGKNNELPWHLPEDLKYFKKVTMGRPIVMGRKTYASIGKPLPGRENIILTTNKQFQAEGCTIIHSVEEMLERFSDTEEEIFIIGGAEIFQICMDYVDRLYITYIDAEFSGDVFFPKIDETNWILRSEEKGLKDERNPYDYYFRVYERKK